MQFVGVEYVVPKATGTPSTEAPSLFGAVQDHRRWQFHGLLHFELYAWSQQQKLGRSRTSKVKCLKRE